MCSVYIYYTHIYCAHVIYTQVYPIQHIRCPPASCRRRLRCRAGEPQGAREGQMLYKFIVYHIIC